MGIDFFGGGGSDTFSSVKISDTDSSNYLTLDWNENDTSDRTLNFAVGGGTRTLTINGNATLNDWFDQAVKAASTPTFAGMTLTAFSGVVKATAGVLAGGATKADIGLTNVEDTALSTWAGTANITTLGTIATGTWSATAITNAKGGTGQDSSLWTGYPYVTTGTWAADTQLGWSSGVLSAQTTSGTNTDTELSMKGKGTGDGVVNLYGGGTTYYHVIRGSDAEGIAGGAIDMRIGLDETTRNLILCDRGDIAVDYGFTATSYPTMWFLPADGTLNYCYGQIGLSDASTFLVRANTRDLELLAARTLNIKSYATGGPCIRLWHAADVASGDVVTLSGWTATQELTDTDGRQAGLSISIESAQTGTAALDVLYVNPTLTSSGTGATGDGNNLLNLSVSSALKFRVDTTGLAHGQVLYNADSDTDEVDTTTIGTENGLLVFGCSTDGVTGIFRLEGGAIVIVSCNANVTATKDNAATYNVYYEGGVICVQNKVGNNKVLKLAFYGI